MSQIWRRNQRVDFRERSLARNTAVPISAVRKAHARRPQSGEFGASLRIVPEIEQRAVFLDQGFFFFLDAFNRRRLPRDPKVAPAPLDDFRRIVETEITAGGAERLHVLRVSKDNAEAAEKRTRPNAAQFFVQQPFAQASVAGFPDIEQRITALLQQVGERRQEIFRTASRQDAVEARRTRNIGL